MTHVHQVTDRTGTSDGAVVNHTHALGGLTGPAETSRSVSVSIKKFVNGTLELWMRNLNPNGLRLLDVTSTSAMTIVWTAKGAVDGTLNPESSGVIIAANGLTSETNITGSLAQETAQRVQADSGLSGAIQIVLDQIGGLNAAKADLSYVNALHNTQNTAINSKASTTALDTESKARTDGDAELVNALSQDYYTKIQVNGITENLVNVGMYNDDRQQDLDAVYTKTASDLRFAPIGSTGGDLTNYYNKQETDDRYYTKVIADSVFGTIRTMRMMTFGWSDSGGSQLSVPVFLNKVGPQVQMIIPDFKVNSGTVARPFISSSGALPASFATLPVEYRPQADVIVGQILTVANAAKSIGYVIVRISGQVEIYRDALGTSFAANLNSGLAFRTSGLQWSYDD